MCGFDGVRKGNYFLGEPVIRFAVEVRVKSMDFKELCHDKGYRRDDKGM